MIYIRVAMNLYMMIENLFHDINLAKYDMT